MHAQAAFVPSYDSWNFNLMPALPTLLALVHALGITRLLGIQAALRLVSLLPLLGMALLLYRWIGRSKAPDARPLGVAVAATLLWDPVLRWSTLVVRTETWMSFFALLIALELGKTGRRPWRIAWPLALAALFHFEAILLVPPVTIALWPWEARSSLGQKFRLWGIALWDVGIRTLALLSPWVLSVLTHWSLFWEQMAVQFQRLEHGNPFTREAYLFFHSLFLSHGSAKDPPKFFNLAKGIYWILTLLLLAVSAQIAVRKNSPSAKTAPAFRTLAFIASWFAAALYMWVDKQEVWFCALNHYAIWPWVGVLVAFSGELALASRTRRTLIGLTAAYGVLSVLATFTQAVTTPPEYSWPTYTRWVDCIERGILGSRGGEAAVVWQPHVPDVLVELAVRHPRMDLTRALDFPARRDLAWQLTRRLDVLLHTTHFNLPKGTASPHYEGPMRDEDRRLLSREVEMPFGPDVLNRLPAEQPGAFTSQICQEGVFWAHLAIRR